MKTIPFRSVYILALLPGFVLLTMGCAPIRSSAVKTLIEKQGALIDTAKNNTVQFRNQNESRKEMYEKSIKDLNKAMKQVQTFESMVALIFSSNQHVEEKRGADAQAVTYLAGTLYWAKQIGLEQEVHDQFEADFNALEILAASIDTSWHTLDTLNQRVADYSQKTFVRNVDDAFITALIRQTKTDVEAIETVLEKSRKVNEALNKVAKLEPLTGHASARGQLFVSDLIDLLERVKEGAPEEASDAEGQEDNHGEDEP